MFKKKGGRKSRKDGRDDALVVHAKKPTYVSVEKTKSNQRGKLKDDETLATLASHDVMQGHNNFFTSCIGHTLVASLDSGLDGIDNLFFSGFACDEKDHVPPMKKVVFVPSRSDNSILSGDDSVITGPTFCGESYSGLITAGHPDDEITDLPHFVPAISDSRNPRSDNRPIPGKILTIQHLDAQSRDKPDPDEQRDGRTHPPFRDFSKEYTPDHQGQVRIRSVRFIDEVETSSPVPPLQKLLCYKHCRKPSPASGAQQKTTIVAPSSQTSIKIIPSSS